MLLCEIGDFSYDYHIVSHSDELNQATVYRFKAQFESIDVIISVRDINPKIGNTYAISFRPTGESSYKLTGRNKDQFKIISTVNAVVRDFFSSHNAYKILFSANKEEDTRVEFYDKHAVAAIQKLGFVLTSRKETPRNIIYWFARG